MPKVVVPCERKSSVVVSLRSEFELRKGKRNRNRDRVLKWKAHRERRKTGLGCLALDEARHGAVYSRGDTYETSTYKQRGKLECKSKTMNSSGYCRRQAAWRRKRCPNPIKFTE